MSIERINPGARFASAVVHGDTVYLAGQVPSKTIEKGIKEQTGEVLEIIDQVLADSGTDKSKLLSVQIWLSDIVTFHDMNEVWDTWLDRDNMPVRATVEARLANPRIRIEIAAIARR